MLNASERVLSIALMAMLMAGATSAAALQPDAGQQPAASTRATADASVPSAAATAAPTPALAPATTPSPAAPVAVPAPVPAEPPQAGCPVPQRPAAPTSTGAPAAPRPRAAPAVAEDALPAPVAAGPKAGSLAAVAGKGVWVTNFKQTPVDVAAIVATARAAGLTSLWVRTGGKQGYYGDQFLPALVPAAHAAGLRVVAWDFPYLSDPVADARRAQQAFADGIDAFAPDIETAAEGTHATARRVELYLSLVRSYAGTRPIAATVPRPTPHRLATFPYASFGAYADLFAPMIYWSCHEPGELVAQSLAQLGQWLPVAPVGQAYDMGAEGGRSGLPTRAETWRFLDVARRGGAVGASLWTIEQLGAEQLGALTDYPWNSIPVT